MDLYWIKENTSLNLFLREVVGEKPTSTPLESNLILASIDFDQVVGTSGDTILKDITFNQKLIWKLMYELLPNLIATMFYRHLVSSCSNQRNLIYKQQIEWSGI